MNPAEKKNSRKTAWLLGAVAACNALPPTLMLLAVGAREMARYRRQAR